ncbi:MAG TPA: kelch repeat-containing protein, partial [Terriglobales bacterium]|nr:kelch repeat-containing protein [Terriglobales bacterium]
MRRFAVHFALAASLIFGFALVLHGSVLKVLIGSWQPAGNMSSARTNGTAALVPDGRIVFAGGTATDGQPTALVDAFSSNGTFSSLPGMSVARSGHAAILTLSGDLLVTGGRTSGGGATNSAEVFDSLSNTWQILPAAMVEPRSGHTMSQLQDGNILIAGGENSSGPIAALEFYDLASDTFRFAGVLATARKGHSAAALLDGRVLIVGGTMLQADGSTATLASTELYDPANGAVSAGPNLSTPRTGATATTLIDGRVLIAGGS